MASPDYKKMVSQIKDAVVMQLRAEPDKHKNVLSDGGRRLSAYLNLYIFTPLLNFKEDKPSPKELAARVNEVIEQQFKQGSRLMNDLHRLDMSDETIHSVVKKQLEQFSKDYQSQYRPPVRKVEGLPSIPLPTKKAPTPPPRKIETSLRDSKRNSKRSSQQNLDAEFDDMMKSVEQTKRDLDQQIEKENRGSRKGGSPKQK